MTGFKHICSSETTKPNYYYGFCVQTLRMRLCNNTCCMVKSEIIAQQACSLSGGVPEMKNGQFLLIRISFEGHFA